VPSPHRFAVAEALSEKFMCGSFSIFFFLAFIYITIVFYLANKNLIKATKVSNIFFNMGTEAGSNITRSIIKIKSFAIILIIE
jgi:hypothetical protein